MIRGAELGLRGHPDEAAITFLIKELTPRIAPRCFLRGVKNTSGAPEP